MTIQLQMFWLDDVFRHNPVNYVSNLITCSFTISWWLSIINSNLSHLAWSVPICSTPPPATVLNNLFLLSTVSNMGRIWNTHIIQCINEHDTKSVILMINSWSSTILLLVSVWQTLNVWRWLSRSPRQSAAGWRVSPWRYPGSCQPWWPRSVWPYADWSAKHQTVSVCGHQLQTSQGLCSPGYSQSLSHYW